MTIEIAIGLLAAALPLTALIMRMSRAVSPIEFATLRTECRMIAKEIRDDIVELKEKLERMQR